MISSNEIITPIHIENEKNQENWKHLFQPARSIGIPGHSWRFRAAITVPTEFEAHSFATGYGTVQFTFTCNLIRRTYSFSWKCLFVWHGSRRICAQLMTWITHTALALYCVAVCTMWRMREFYCKCNILLTLHPTNPSFSHQCFLYNHLLCWFSAPIFHPFRLHPLGK